MKLKIGKNMLNIVISAVCFGLYFKSWLVGIGLMFVLPVVSIGD